MSTIHQYKIGQEELYSLYRFIILPWEIEWQPLKFKTNEGELKKFEKDQNIALKCFNNISDLESEAAKYLKSYKKFNGVLLFNRTDNKPKAILRHLRNISAHGHFKKGVVNKINCLKIKHYSEKDKRLRAIGHIPFNQLKPLIKAIMTTRQLKVK